MRLQLLTGILIVQFFIVPGSEAKAPVRFWREGTRKEASVSKTTTLPATEDVHQEADINTATQPRRHGSTGGLMTALFFLYPATRVGPSCILQGKESFCMPIALRLLFPGHYFW